MEKVQALTKDGHRRLHQLANIHQEKEIQKLMMYLMKNYQGHLDETQTPVDNAITILEELKGVV